MGVYFIHHYASASSVGRKEGGKEEGWTGLQIEKEQVKCSLFANDMILYVENPMESSKNFLELVSSSRLQGMRSMYKINCISERDGRA